MSCVKSKQKKNKISEIFLNPKTPDQGVNDVPFFAKFYIEHTLFNIAIYDPNPSRQLQIPNL